MAKTLDAFPEEGEIQRGGRYPWNKWLDGQVWRLEKGTPDEVAAGTKDYYVTTKSFRSAVTQACKAKSKKVPGKPRTAVVEEGGEALIVQWIPDEAAEAEADAS